MQSQIQNANSSYFTGANYSGQRQRTLSNLGVI